MEKSAEKIIAFDHDRAAREFFSSSKNLLDDEGITKKINELNAKKERSKSEEAERIELCTELSYMCGHKNGIWASALSHKRYRRALIKIRQDIIQEYDCKTVLEYMLADRITAAYWKAMRIDMVINRNIENEDSGYSFNQLKINALKEMNRTSELAQRQLVLAITSLRELKQPQLSIKLKTETAYIAQNQQIINNNKNHRNQMI